jgi:hypothetical protein
MANIFLKIRRIKLFCTYKILFMFLIYCSTEWRKHLLDMTAVCVKWFEEFEKRILWKKLYYVLLLLRKHSRENKSNLYFLGVWPIFVNPWTSRRSSEAFKNFKNWFTFFSIRFWKSFSFPFEEIHLFSFNCYIQLTLNISDRLSNE